METLGFAVDPAYFYQAILLHTHSSRVADISFAITACGISRYEGEGSGTNCYYCGSGRCGQTGASFDHHQR